MKKITYVLIMLIMFAALVACNDNAGTANDAAFKKYLEETKPLNSATLDSLVEENADLQLPADLFGPIVIDNTKISIETSEVEFDVYAWQEAEKIYINAPTNEADMTITESRYLDLSQLETMYDEAISQLSQLDADKPSELYEKVISEYGYDLGLAGTPLEKRTLDELLDVFNYKYTDFRKVEEGKYAVKDEVLFAKILKWSYEEITVEQFIQMLTESQMQFNLYAYFDGKHISAYEVVAKETDGDEVLEVKIKLSFLYNEDECYGIKVDGNFGEYDVTLEIKVVEESLVAQLVVDVPSVQKVVIDLKLSSNSLEFSIVNNDETMCDVDLQYGITQTENSTKLYLSGSIVYDEFAITITNGSEVVIPSDRLATKDAALNLLESVSVQ